MTSLCVVPNCRIRGRHLTTCADDDCSGCLPRATDDGLVCDVCTGSAGSRLAHIVQLTPDAMLVAYGLVRRTAGGGSGKPGSRSPGNDDAMVVLDDVNNRLTTICREIADVRGLQEPVAGLGVAATLTTASQWLSGQMNWLRHAVDDQGGPYAASVFAEIRDCASRMRSLVDGPTHQRYLGPCGADVVRAEIVGDQWESELVICDGDVYGRAGADLGTCRTCGAHVDQGERLIWLDDVRRDWLYFVSEIADAYPIKATTIRAWLSRGLLVAHGERDGRPLLKLGEVLDLAAGDAARREEARATRARRSAAKAAENEEAA